MYDFVIQIIIELYTLDSEDTLLNSKLSKVSPENANEIYENAMESLEILRDYK